jgi:hypothetical protein
LLTTSVRGRELGPTTAASSFEGWSGFCSAFDWPPPVAVFGAACFSGFLVGIAISSKFEMTVARWLSGWGKEASFP